jgi:SAM-dependent methyltransferase
MPDSVTTPAAPVSNSDYDGFAAEYSARNDKSLFNAFYERPEMIRLAGAVDGLRVLDAGCGSGPLTEALEAKGAVVSGFDVSPAMVELARQRLGEDADVSVADLGASLPYAEDTSTSLWHHCRCTTWRIGPSPWASCGVCSSPRAALPSRSSIP